MRNFTSQVDEVRYFRDRPHLKPPGRQTIISEPINRDLQERSDDLEFIPQDKTNTLEYRIAHDISDSER